MDDSLDEFIEFDATMGSDMVKCPNCGTSVGKSLLFDGEVQCPECGQKIGN